MSALLKLAERCEQAEGPDREIDVHIWIALSGASAADVEAIMTCMRLSLNVERCPLFTASLDAAMTLLPERHSWEAGNCGEGLRPWATVTMPSSTGGWQFSGDAITVPLALCAAALRARAATGEGM